MNSSKLELPGAAAADLMKAARDGYIVLTRGNKPVAYVLPTSIYDEEDIGYMTDPAFWKMIAERRNSREPCIPLEQLLKELEVSAPISATPHKKSAARKKRNHAPS